MEAAGRPLCQTCLLRAFFTQTLVNVQDSARVIVCAAAAPDFLVVVVAAAVAVVLQTHGCSRRVAYVCSASEGRSHALDREVQLLHGDSVLIPALTRSLCKGRVQNSSELVRRSRSGGQGKITAQQPPNQNSGAGRRWDHRCAQAPQHQHPPLPSSPHPAARLAGHRVSQGPRPARKGRSRWTQHRSNSDTSPSQCCHTAHPRRSVCVRGRPSSRGAELLRARCRWRTWRRPWRAPAPAAPYRQSARP